MDFADYTQGAQWAKRLPHAQRKELAYNLLLSLPRQDVVDLQAYLTTRLQKDIVGDLPVELSVMVLKNLPLDDLLSCGLVSKKWGRAVNDQAMWRQLCDEASPPVRLAPTTWLDLDLHRALVPQDSEYDPFAMSGGVRANVWERGTYSRLPLVRAEAVKQLVPSHLPLSTPQPTPNFKHLRLVDRILAKRMRSEMIPNSSVLDSMASTRAGGLPGHDMAVYCLQLVHHPMHVTRPRSCAGECSTHPGYFPILPAEHAPHCPEKISVTSRDWLLSGSRDQTLRMWALSPTPHVVKVFKGHDSSVLTLSARGSKAVGGGSDGRLCLWNLEGDDEPIKAIQAHRDSILCVRMDDKRIVTCSKDWTIRTFDIHLEPLLVLGGDPDGHTAAVNAVALSHELIVSASGDRTVRVWDAEKGTLLHSVAGHTRGIACLDVDFVNQMVVTGSGDSFVRSFEIGKSLAEGVTFSVTCQCPNPRQGCLRCGTGHTEMVRSVHLGRDVVISGSYDQSVKVWDRSGRLLTDLAGAHAGRIFAVTSDKMRIVSSGLDARIVIWDYSAGLDTAFVSPS